MVAQTTPSSGERIFRFSSAHTSFPESKRQQGYTHDSVFYDTPTHYSDSTVMVLVPAHFKARNKKVDIVYWFHGWRNSIDSALNYYHLSSQFHLSQRNAVLVLAETAKNAADSYGGKLEQEGIFNNLLNDVLKNLVLNKIIPSDCRAGNILLAGHSGAYRVIAYILQNGGVEVKQVLLFDALYSETDKYMAWLNKDASHEFLHFYTSRGGGTDEVSVKMMADLKEKDLSFGFTEETNRNAALLRKNRINFIHSARGHNDIIFNPDNFRFFLEHSPFLKKIKNR